MRLGILVLLVPLAAQAQLRPVAALPINGACDDLDLPSLAAAIEVEQAVLAKKSSPPLKFAERSVVPSEYARATLGPLAQLAKAGDMPAVCSALRERFAWYKTSDAQVLMTAYHTPFVRASMTKDATYQWPLYKRPPDANNHSTAQILGGSLAGRGLELIWLSNPYDALALHVEGAANVQLPDGKTIHIGADGHNGMAYQNVSKLLAADGKMPPGPPPPATQPGNPKARKYFTEHPADLNVYWGRNPHFVYFKLSAHGGSGKLGALTPHRSIAIDPTVVPMGAVLFIRAQKPLVTDGKITGMQPYTRIVLGQDTGAGIKGPGRIDVYYGDDEYAQVASAATSVQGDAYALVAK